MSTSKARRLVGFGVVAASVSALVASAAVATTPGSRTDVSYIGVDHRVLNNTYVAAHGSTSPVVIGGSTTVPSDATAVRLTVSVKGSAAGSLLVHPAGNPDGASGDTVSWTATKIGSGVISENIGTSNEITFVNQSTRPINITATITGYSTQVSAADVSGGGGSAGQVLTDDGHGGASWQTPSTVYDQSWPRSMLPSTPQPGYDLDLYLPAGSYLVDVTGTIERATADADVTCHLIDSGSGGGTVATARVAVDASAADESLSLQSVLTLPEAAYVGVNCFGSQAAWVLGYGITALQVGTVTPQ